MGTMTVLGWHVFATAVPRLLKSLMMKDLKHLRELYSTPVLLTSDHMDQHQVLCDALRLPFLAKPFTDETLLAWVQKLATPVMDESLVS